MDNAYLVWDWNGTLWEDVDAAVFALNRMLGARGLSGVDRAYYRAHFGFPVRPFYASLGVDFEHDDWDRICVDFHRFYAAAPGQRLRADARAALERARALGFRQCVLSALREDILKRDLAREGIDGFFDEIFGTDNLDGASKLDRGRALVAHVRAVAGDGPRIVFVGDTLHDAEVARELGGECVLVDCGHQTPERLAATGREIVPSLVAAVDAAAKTGERK